jgi:hypothetical protein
MGALICTIELNKTGGTTVSVKDEEGKITQTIVMDGKSITVKVLKEDDSKSATITMDQTKIVSTVAGEETSTVTQVHDTLTMKVKNFVVDAETVKMTSSKTTDIEAKDAMTVKATKALSVSTDDAFTLKSMKAMTVEATGAMNVETKQALAVKALKGEVKTEAALTIESTGNFEIKGSVVNITGSARAAMVAPVTNLGRTVTVIKGGVVQLDGGLVKIG